MLRSSILSKIESMTKRQQTEVVINIPKKLDSSILNKIEKKGTTFNPVLARSLIKEKEHQEFEKIEKMSTFEKVVKLQNILKEIASMKIRFEANKDQILSKIKINTFKFYENKINMKEIYDYCQSDNLEDFIKYELISEPIEYFDEKGKDLYKDIYEFFFLIRNNNKLMLKLIDKCDKEDYENLSDFLVNFCYEDTINSSFIQEELMLLIYLILEKNILKLPKEILNNDNNISFDLFRNDENLIYHLLRSLSRKADVRNFLCSILLDSINILQEDRKNLTLDINYIQRKSVIGEGNNDYLLNNSLDENIIDKFEKINTEHRHYTTWNKNIENKLRLSSIKSVNGVKKNKVKDDLENHSKNENKVNNNEIKDENVENFNQEQKNEDIFLIPENISKEELDKIKLDSFFENNNVSLNYLQKKLKDIKNISRNSNINSAMKEYIEILIKDIKDGKEEIYSNEKMINYLKLMKINEQKEEKEKDSGENLDEKINNIKNNYNIITNIIDEIISKIKENITKIPVIIKCLSNIIEQLLNKKYIERKPKKLIGLYQKYIFKSNIFYGNFFIGSLSNLDYNGIVVSDIISNTTVENISIIINIIDKMLSGKLFTNCYEVFYNKYIIETLPKFFEIIDSVEKNFKLPDVIQRLVNTCTDIKNNKRLNDFEYDYFFEKNEEIRAQSLCFNFDNLLIFIKLAKKNIEELITYDKEEEKDIINKILGYEFFLNDLNEKNKINEKKCEFFYLIKINFSNRTEKKINYILRDNFVQINQTQNIDKVSFIKKCLIEVLEYASVISKNNFKYFVQNPKRKIYNQDIADIIFRKNRLLEYENIINKKDIHLDFNEEDLKEKNLNFRSILFENILEFLKLEIENNYSDLKIQRIVFCAFYAQTNLRHIPKEYKENNYNKLLTELIKETMEKLNYLNSNILNLLHNKVKEGNKLNLIITSNYYQIKSLEKFKCIEYLYYKSLLPLEFKIEKGENNIIKKIEYIKEEENDKKEEENKKENSVENLEFFLVEKDEPKKEPKEEQKEEPKKEIKKELKEPIPNFRKFEDSIDDIIKLEEDCGMEEALKEYFKKLKKVIKNEKITKRFSKDEIESILIELENHILYKLYDKLYPLKTTKLDDKFYKKCCRLNFIKPENIITDKNIYNERLWQLSIDYLNEINNKYTPRDKLKVVLKSFGILQNSITFSSGKKELGVDDTIKPLIYVLIKSKPKNIFTNYNFCQLFLNDNLTKTQFGILLTQLYMIMNIIKEMKFNELIGVTEEQFGKDEE